MDDRQLGDRLRRAFEAENPPAVSATEIRQRAEMPQHTGTGRTARKQVGVPDAYSALLDRQAPRSPDDQVRQAGQSDLELLLQTTEVARRLQVSARTVLAWAQAGKLPSILTPGGHRRYPAQGVEQVLQIMQAAGEPRRASDSAAEDTESSEPASGFPTNVLSLRDRKAAEAG